MCGMHANAERTRVYARPRAAAACVAARDNELEGAVEHYQARRSTIIV